MKNLFGIAFALLLLAAPAAAQNAIQQAGPATPGHTTIFIQNGLLGDAGPASGGGPGIGLSELSLAYRGNGSGPWAAAGTGPYGTNFCDYDGPTNSPNGYHYLCFSANALGGGLIAYGAGGGASELPLQIYENDQLVSLGGGSTTTCMPRGYQQITNLTVATSLTPPAGAHIAYIIAEVAPIRWRDDGTAPTASVGNPVGINSQLIYNGNLSAISIIQQASGGIIDVDYCG